MSIQRNKRFGLMKLKKIAGAKNPNWLVSPHIVLTKNQKLTKSKIGNSSRLLTRTDETGINYREYEPYHMPRDDIHMITMDGKARRPAEDAHWATQAVRKLPKSVLMIHPTRNRKKIRWTGRIEIEGPTKARTTSMLTLHLAKNQENNPIHRQITPDTTINIPIAENEIKTDRMNNAFFKAHPDAFNIVKKTIEFVNKGIKQKQINPRRAYTELSFLTWKDKPDVVELFDLVERRRVQESQLKRRTADKI